MAAFTREDLEEWFKEFDTDGNGRIDTTELRNLVKSFAEWQELAYDEAKIEADVKSMLQTVDTSGDGKIDKEEFFKFYLTD